MQRNYFYLPPPQYQLYSEAKVLRSFKQICGFQREDNGDISYLTNTGKYLSESSIKSGVKSAYVGLIWHLDMHFEKRSYHAENVTLEQTFRPVKVSDINTNAWAENIDSLNEWICNCIPADVTLTVRNCQGFLIDAWHLYDVFCDRDKDEYGIYELDLNFTTYLNSKVKHEGLINYEVSYRDCSIIAKLNCGVPIIVKKLLPSFENVNETIMKMRNRYENNMKLFLLDAAIQDEKEIFCNYIV